MTQSAGTGADAVTGTPGQRAALADSSFLAIVVLLSAVPYIGGLGVYSDDWSILANLAAADGSPGRMWQAMMEMGVSTRPVQGIVLIGLYVLFGLEPLGYHLANIAGLAAAAVLFHLSLRRLGVPRIVALAAPLVFALLPHYSTDRFWIAAFQANASVLLYFLSLHSDLRFVAARGRAAWGWKAAAIVALIGSVLAYEVTGALFLLNVVVLAWAAGLRGPPPWPAQSRRVVAGLVLNVLALAAAIVFKLATTQRAGMGGGLRFRVLRIFTEGGPVHFGELGAELPLRVYTVLRHHADAAGIIVSLLIGVVTFLYLYRAWRANDAVLNRVRIWLIVAAAGFIVYAAGYGVSLTTWEIGFHATGANNRTAVGAAIGTALVFTGVAGVIAALLPGRVQRASFGLLIAFIAASGVLILDTVGGLWAAASVRQNEIIDNVRLRYRTLPDSAVVLLDGLCPYVGPAPVFATDWDVKGMLRIQYGERHVDGDVILPNTEVLAEGIRTTLFDDWIKTYPYGERLFVLHVGSGKSAVLVNEAAARNWFQTVSRPGRPPCPSWTHGDGVDVF
jgi:hypothetical protein